ncbi:hypothetical protein KIPB_016876, partial [Kipferlia bialata]
VVFNYGSVKAAFEWGMVMLAGPVNEGHPLRRYKDLTIGVMGIDFRGLAVRRMCLKHHTTESVAQSLYDEV